MRRVTSFERRDGRPTGGPAEACSALTAGRSMSASVICARPAQAGLLTLSLTSLIGP